MSNTTDSTSDELVTINVEAGVADVRLNRPNKYNALSQDMFKAIVAAGERLALAKDVRCVVLSGNGRGFCAGLDMDSFAAMSDAPDNADGSLLERTEWPENFAQRPAMVWKRMPVPVISAIHGVAYGGGAQIALGADIRIAAPDVKMSIMEIKWGMIPDMSITQTLRDLVPLDVAKELTFTGRVLSGEAACDIGLVTLVDEHPHDRAMAMAQQIAGQNPDAIRAAKQLFESAWHANEREGLELEAALQTSLIGSSNQLEAIAANFEKRPPNFRDPS